MCRTKVLIGGPLAHQGGHGILTRGPQVRDLFTVIDNLRTIDAFMLFSLIMLGVHEKKLVSQVFFLFV